MAAFHATESFFSFFSTFFLLWHTTNSVSYGTKIDLFVGPRGCIVVVHLGPAHLFHAAWVPRAQGTPFPGKRCVIMYQKVLVRELYEDTMTHAVSLWRSPDPRFSRNAWQRAQLEKPGLYAVTPSKYDFVTNYEFHIGILPSSPSSAPKTYTSHTL